MEKIDFMNIQLEIVEKNGKKDLVCTDKDANVYLRKTIILYDCLHILPMEAGEKNLTKTAEESVALALQTYDAIKQEQQLLFEAVARFAIQEVREHLTTLNQLYILAEAQYVTAIKKIDKCKDKTPSQIAIAEIDNNIAYIEDALSKMDDTEDMDIIRDTMQMQLVHFKKYKTLNQLLIQLETNIEKKSGKMNEWEADKRIMFNETNDSIHQLILEFLAINEEANEVLNDNRIKQAIEDMINHNDSQMTQEVQDAILDKRIYVTKMDRLIDTAIPMIQYSLSMFSNKKLKAL